MIWSAAMPLLVRMCKTRVHRRDMAASTLPGPSSGSAAITRLANSSRRFSSSSGSALTASVPKSVTSQPRSLPEPNRKASPVASAVRNISSNTYIQNDHGCYRNDINHN
jgi:hypothetical protein